MFRGLFTFVSFLAVNFGTCTRLDVGVERAGEAFFIKPVFHGQQFITLNKQKPFVVTKGTGTGIFHAQYGPFQVRKTISDPLLQSVLGSESFLGNRLVLGDLDISAHLVSDTITPERPLLQVLFHAGKYSDYGQSGVDKNTKSYVPRKGDINQDANCSCQWLMTIYVKNLGQELNSSCVLHGVNSVCLAQINLPLSWWWADKPNTVNVYYAVSKVKAKTDCTSDSTLFDQLETDSILYRRRTVAPINLNRGQLTYQEHRDLHILVYMPKGGFHPGSKLRVPVKLETGSDLTRFEMRVKVRSGLHVVGVEARNPDTWHISQEALPSDRRASVTAQLSSRSSLPSDRVEEVFDWILGVDDSPRAPSGDKSDVGRVIFILSYRRRQGGRDVAVDTGDVQSKIVGRVVIQDDNVYDIVPIIKTDELVNTAVLTGRPQNHAMQIYAIMHTGDVAEVTSRTTCHSANDSMLKVAQDCRWVYLDGTETAGSPRVNMIAKYRDHTKSLFFKVWVPEMPLEIELSDEKLSQIKWWKVPTHANSATTVSGRGEKVPGDNDGLCTVRYQQSIIEVYARFYVPEVFGKTYLAHKKALFSVTELVLDSLRVADESIATMRGNVVQGMQPGRTEVQVMSQPKSQGMRPIAAKQFRVTSSDKVELNGLGVGVVTDIDVVVVREDAIPGTLVAKIVSKTLLERPQQKGILDVSLRFSDSTVMPLHLVPEVDYTLSMDTLNSTVLQLGKPYSADTPLVVAVTGGQGRLKLSLEPRVGTCRRRKVKVLTVAFVNVGVEFPTTKDDGWVNDAGWESGHQPPGRRRGEEAAPSRKPNTEAHQQPIGGTGEMTALEIGMYVLLGVFCIAIAMFVVNCVIFVLRYKQKQLPGASGGSRGDGRGRDRGGGRRGSVSYANDWVWIGRETLQRNAIQTDCNQALMSEHDFTVNKTVAKFLLPQSNPSSNRSSACGAGSGCGGAGAGGGANGGSNRNSIVSTYKGSECSIRITPNPLPLESNTVPRQRSAATGAGASSGPCAHPPMHTFHGPPRTTPRRTGGGGGGGSGTGQLAGARPHEGALSDIQSASALSASSSDDPSTFSSLPSYSSRGGGGGGGGPRVPTPSQQARLAQVALEMAQHGPLVEQQALLAQAAAQIAEREEDAANGNITDTSADWDYEAMGMTYDELMEYFDNLKESTA